MRLLKQYLEIPELVSVSKEAKQLYILFLLKRADIKFKKTICACKESTDLSLELPKNIYLSHDLVPLTV
jgi:hypothetical protein